MRVGKINNFSLLIFTLRQYRSTFLLVYPDDRRFGCHPKEHPSSHCNLVSLMDLRPFSLFSDRTKRFLVLHLVRTHLTLVPLCSVALQPTIMHLIMKIRPPQAKLQFYRASNYEYMRPAKIVLRLKRLRY